MISVAPGMTIGGKIPFVGTFANFATGRVYDQIRQSVCYSNKNVKICASHAGLTLGEDGATHQILEDIGLMRMLPNMKVVVPCDFNQTKLATTKISQIDSPFYLRFGRPKVPNFTLPDDPNFEIGKIQTLVSGSDVSIFTNGHLVWTALKAAEELLLNNISVSVLNVHTVKPIDVEGILKEVLNTKAVVIAEEHQINGGLCDLISQILGRNIPLPVECVAVNDSFGESGTPDELLIKYGLGKEDILKAVNKVLKRK